MARKIVAHEIVPLSIFYTLGIFIHLLVIAKAIPYTWVNGGISGSYSIQLAQSLISIVALVVLGLFCGRLLRAPAKQSQRNRYILGGITALWAFGFMMQLAGTSFERYVMAPILAIGVLAHLRLRARITPTSSR